MIVIKHTRALFLELFQNFLHSTMQSIRFHGMVCMKFHNVESVCISEFYINEKVQK